MSSVTRLTCKYSYPDDNCAALYEGFGDPKDPQAAFAKYLDHSMGVNTIQPYLNSTMIAQQAGKQFIMFETNSASCSGFPGISTSFGAALWALDYGLEMAASNFSHALLHVGGQNVYYNVSGSRHCMAESRPNEHHVRRYDSLSQVGSLHHAAPVNRAHEFDSSPYQ